MIMRTFVLLSIAFAVWSCNDNRAPQTSAPEAVAETTVIEDAEVVPVEKENTPTAPYEAIVWKMYSFSLDGESYRPYKDTLVTLELRNGKAKGTGGCNQFAGNYAATEKGDFSMSDFTASGRTCANLMGTESRYFKVLKEATTWKVDRMVLELSSPTGKIQFLNMSAPRVRVEE